ncbi:hypothetical protein RaK2_00473 [Klebsiella phage vB_KleM_RaK2]|uniref:Uncharacterized protein n=1 Tax=Klebsiella phage vB_KleM_RaK2 TaxID=1147094 RepID=H6X4T0_9CAUD|nr:hypothetical protein F403_gp062 [Klebsiella phage vB_KleM_RaK2]AFA44746.1 hypothetical protein RaK2_00473 [Klebsiella phage vB_KleM_RaK2]
MNKIKSLDIAYTLFYIKDHTDDSFYKVIVDYTENLIQELNTILIGSDCIVKPSGVEFKATIDSILFSSISGLVYKVTENTKSFYSYRYVNPLKIEFL